MLGPFTGLNRIHFSPTYLVFYQTVLLLNKSLMIWAWEYGLYSHFHYWPGTFKLNIPCFLIHHRHNCISLYLLGHCKPSEKKWWSNTMSLNNKGEIQFCDNNISPGCCPRLFPVCWFYSVSFQWCELQLWVWQLFWAPRFLPMNRWAWGTPSTEKENSQTQCRFQGRREGDRRGREPWAPQARAMDARCVQAGRLSLFFPKLKYG